MEDCSAHWSDLLLKYLGSQNGRRMALETYACASICLYVTFEESADCETPTTTLAHHTNTISYVAIACKVDQNREPDRRLCHLAVRR